MLLIRDSLLVLSWFCICSTVGRDFNRRFRVKEELLKMRIGRADIQEMIKEVHYNTYLNAGYAH
jgi:hypothetical protein